MLIDLIPFYTDNQNLPSGRTYDCLLLIDVFRATSFIVTSAHQGAVRWQTTQTVTQAREIKKNHPEILLCGERGNQAPKGFDYGNSPVEISHRDLSGKELVVTTTNGTRCLSPMKGSYRNAYALSLLNRSYVVTQILTANPSSLLIVCAGNTNAFSLEDFLCAAIFLNSLNQGSHRRLSFGHQKDATLLALETGQRIDDDEVYLERTLRTTTHACTLRDAGLEKDIQFILEHRDQMNVLPEIHPSSPTRSNGTPT